MDHSMHTLLDASSLTETDLMDAPVYGADDAKIGRIGHVHGSGMSMQVIVDAGGFLGIGTKPIAIGADALTFMRDENGDVHATTSWTKEQVMALPSHDHMH